MRVLFIASNPSRLNIDKDVPLVGSKSEKVFKEWAKKLQVKSFKVVNASNIVKSGRLREDEIQYDKVKKEYDAYKPDKVVCLGKTASRVARKLGLYGCYELPHPSPRNRKLNDKVYIERILNNCRLYIHELYII